MAREARKSIGEIILEGTLIERALRRAAREAVRRHKLAGLPIPVWRNGKTISVNPDEIQIPDDEEERAEGPATAGKRQSRRRPARG